MKSILISIYKRIVELIDSQWFIFIIIGLFIIQALWVALFFRFPLVFDEHFHLNVIKVFSEQWSPVIINQSKDLDFLGSLTFGNASFYHYLMSFPLRLTEMFFGQRDIIQIVSLRVINVVFVALGIFVFSRVFREIGTSNKISNIALLLYISLPMVLTVAATVSYDNLTFLLTAAFTLIGVKIIKKNQLDAPLIIGLISLGMLASLIKFTFLPIFVASLVFVSVYLMRSHRKRRLKQFVRSFNNINKRFIILAIVISVTIIGLFIFRYGFSVVRYGSPIPNCIEVLPKERCMKNSVIAMEQKTLLENKDKPVMTPFSYAWGWTRGMLNGYTGASVNTEKGIAVAPSPSIFIEALSIGLTLGLLLLIYMWRSLQKNTEWYFLAVVAGSLILATFLFNIQSYYTYHMNVNVQSRYMLSILPIIFMMIMVALTTLIGKRVWPKVVIGLLVAIAMTQGGGILTHMSGAREDWFWDKGVVRDIGAFAQKIVNVVIINR